MGDGSLGGKVNCRRERHLQLAAARPANLSRDYHFRRDHANGIDAVPKPDGGFGRAACPRSNAFTPSAVLDAARPRRELWHIWSTDIVYASRWTAHRTRFGSCSKAKMELFDYIEVFDKQWRRHSTLGQISPAAFERRAHRPGVALPSTTCVGADASAT